MTLYVLLALLNGVLIGTSRAVNGQLSTRVGPFKASVWNHAVGFAFLTVVLFALSSWPNSGSAPVAAYLGGAVGALFVAVNSHVFPRLGAMNASLLVISGQVLSAVTIDCIQEKSAPSAIRLLGVVLVLAGLSLPRLTAQIRRNRKETQECPSKTEQPESATTTETGTTTESGSSSTTS
ncbi:DMT family transporter [Streptomyces sp. NPDC060223]|uniref:DMT family transporter n=1 Tax=unclassified Streptomyces TaxID=2593676 RepID=UPI003626461E